MCTEFFSDKLWTAPEFLRMLDAPMQGSLEGDLFSFAIIIQEILCRDRPYCNDNLSPGGTSSYRPSYKQV